MSVLIKPIITEKSMEEVKKGRFTFAVVKTADKRTIRREVKERFNVDVVSIFTNITKGKKKRSGARKQTISLPDVKKAVVTLKSGQKIDLFDVGQ